MKILLELFFTIKKITHTGNSNFSCCFMINFIH